MRKRRDRQLVCCSEVVTESLAVYPKSCGCWTLPSLLTLESHNDILPGLDCSSRFVAVFTNCRSRHLGWPCFLCRFNQGPGKRPCGAFNLAFLRLRRAMAPLTRAIAKRGCIRAQGRSLPIGLLRHSRKTWEALRVPCGVRSGPVACRRQKPIGVVGKDERNKDEE